MGVEYQPVDLPRGATIPCDIVTPIISLGFKSQTIDNSHGLYSSAMELVILTFLDGALFSFSCV